MATSSAQNQEERIKELHRQEAEELAKILSNKYKVPYIDLSGVSINTDALRLIPQDQAKTSKTAAFALTGKKIHLAALSPQTENVSNMIKNLRERGFQTELYITSSASLERAWERYKEISYSVETRAGLIDISGDQIALFMKNVQELEGLKQYIVKLTEDEKGRGISLLLEIILAGAIKMKASDIHLEPQEEMVRLRYRLDGVLQDIGFLSHKTYKLIGSRLKLISNLKLNIRSSAQDGRFTVTLETKELEVRTSVLPGAYGESIVLRILDPESMQISLPEMGIEPYLLEIFRKEIKKPNGMVLVTGPTGSGKTTTLYAFLNNVNEPGKKIITIEDPIEYHLKGIAQTQTNEEAGYTFLEGLRSALRQDPDIIMIGEIRDQETASVAMNSALTGHLVFSTLHTNNAAGTIPRLIDLKVNPKIIGSALNIAIAQRLARRLCQECKQEKTPTQKEKKIIEEVLSSIAKKRPDLKIEKKEKIWQAGKCEHCDDLGYKGRIGIFEAILIGEKIGKMITENSNENEIREISASQGILDMREDGIMKVLSGITSIEELERVIEI